MHASLPVQPCQETMGAPTLQSPIFFAFSYRPVFDGPLTSNDSEELANALGLALMIDLIPYGVAPGDSYMSLAAPIKSDFLSSAGLVFWRKLFSRRSKFFKGYLSRQPRQRLPCSTYTRVSQSRNVFDRPWCAVQRHYSRCNSSGHCPFSNARRSSVVVL